MTFTPSYFTGFEMGEMPIVATNYSDVSVSADQQYTGAYSLDLGQNGGHASFPISGSPSELYLTFYARPIDSGWLRCYIILGDASEIYIEWDDANEYWDAYVDGVKVADGTINHVNTTWENVQMRVVISDSGLISTKVSGYTDIAYSGDTKVGSSTAIAYIKFARENNKTGRPYIDDFAYGTGGWPGAIRVSPQAVTGDSATQEFELSAGSDAYALVDEVPPVTTDYIYADADGEQSILTVEDYADAYGELLAVNLFAYVQKTTGNADKLAFISSDGTNTTVHSLQEIPTGSWKYINQILTTAPDGGAWTDTDVDNLQMGFDAEIV